MDRGLISTGLVSCLVVCSGCTTTAFNADRTNAELERLDLRLNQLERRLGKGSASDDPRDSKEPAGPLLSLTLRLGTEDDRLRLYWADGQTSDLICTEEGKTTWACG